VPLRAETDVSPQGDVVACVLWVILTRTSAGRTERNAGRACNVDSRRPRILITSFAVYLDEFPSVRITDIRRSGNLTPDSDCVAVTLQGSDGTPISTEVAVVRFRSAPAASSCNSSADVAAGALRSCDCMQLASCAACIMCGLHHVRLASCAGAARATLLVRGQAGASTRPA
jgi:hypothetical protein